MLHAVVRPLIDTASPSVDGVGCISCILHYPTWTHSPHLQLEEPVRGPEAAAVTAVPLVLVIVSPPIVGWTLTSPMGWALLHGKSKGELRCGALGAAVP